MHAWRISIPPLPRALGPAGRASSLPPTSPLHASAFTARKMVRQRQRSKPTIRSHCTECQNIRELNWIRYYVRKGHYWGFPRIDPFDVSYYQCPLIGCPEPNSPSNLHRKQIQHQGQQKVCSTPSFESQNPDLWSVGCFIPSTFNNHRHLHCTNVLVTEFQRIPDSFCASKPILKYKAPRILYLGRRFQNLKNIA